MDALTFASPAKIRVLLIPIGDISRAKFDRWAELVRRFSSFNLSDLPTSSRDPSALQARGEVLVHYCNSYDKSHSFLSPFSLHRQVLAVLGIADCSPPANASTFNGVSEALRLAHPHALVHRCYAVEQSAADQPEEANGSGGGASGKPEAGLVVIPKHGDPKMYLSTLLGDMVGSVIEGLHAYITSLENTPMSTPRPSLDMSVAPPEAFSPPLLSSSKRFSIPPHQLSRSGSGDSVTSTGATPSASSASTSANKKGRANAPPPVMGNGRHLKVLADAHLLSGRLSDAISSYETSISFMPREKAIAGGFNAPWYASALEGLAVARVLVERQFQLEQGIKSQRHGSSAPTVPSKDKKEEVTISDTWRDIVDIYMQAVSVYSKSLAPLHESQVHAEHTHPLLHSEACIALSHLLLAVWSCPGWTTATFDFLLYGGRPPPFADGVPDLYTLVKLSARTGVPRTEIADSAAQAYNPSFSALRAPDQVRILSSIANVYGCIGFKRREAFFLRQLSFTVTQLLIRNRPSSGTNSAAIPGSGDATPKKNKTGPASLLVLQEQAKLNGNESILDMIRTCFKAYGMSVDDERARKVDLAEPAARPPDILPPRFGWADLQVRFLEEAVAIAEQLSDYSFVLKFVIYLVREHFAFLKAEDQFRLVSGAMRILAMARRRSTGSIELDYYGPSKPILGIEVSPLPPNKYPYEQALSDVAPDGRVSELASRTDPLLYNPRFKGKIASKTILIQNELAEVTVTFVNPLSIPLDFDSIQLSTTGAAFTSHTVSATIPPNSFHPVRVTGVPTETGAVVIRGCKARLSCSSEREFLVPVETEAKSKERAIKLDEANDQSLRLKRWGLDVRTSEDAPSHSKRGSSRKSVPVPDEFLECTVVPEQPLLRVDSSTLMHGALMLFDGERTSIRIKLENTSPFPIDFVKVSFQDSLTEATQLALDDGDLSPLDVYELEYDLIHRPVFTHDKATNRIQIPAHSSVVLKVRCLGKLDCATGTIQVDYALVNRPGLAQPSLFYTRQLLIPVTLSVHQILDIQSFDILPLNRSTARNLCTESARHGHGVSDADASLSTALAEKSDDGYCLLVADMRNVYGSPFEVTFERIDDPDAPFMTIRTIPPGATLRFLVPLRRFRLDGKVTGEPVPALTERQFVVAKEKRSRMEERDARKLFWYREELLKRLRASWKEPHTGRTGRFTLRSLTLSKPMLHVLQEDDLSITLSLRPSTAVSATSSVVQESEEMASKESLGRAYIVQAEEFVEVFTRVVNRGPRPLKLLHRLQALPASSQASSSMNTSWPPPQPDPFISSHLIVSGSLSSPLQSWPLAIGDEGTAVTRICFLAEGDYEFASAVEEVREGARRPGKADETSSGKAAEEGAEAEGERVVQVSTEPLRVRVFAAEAGAGEVGSAP